MDRMDQKRANEDLDNDDGSSSSSTSNLLDMRNEEGWEDVEDDTIQETFVSLFDTEPFNNVTDMFRYCKDKHGFDIWSLRKQFG